ncbi:alpha-amylase family glycosyl hydrolase [Porphyromonas cangingivalis]|uniref:alpha-amylase family glycosyl hydrolase n=1 Tax=Porphyromonas cangingivalis TaxID=36874 RepID=UPI00242C4B05|nr:alpha-amylase family glycosyl hydrolase [Porphyromonas cangingivalis]
MNEQKISIYQVLPRLFDNKCENCVPYGDIKTNGVGKMNAFTPKALAAIKDLGITHIWYIGLLEHATKTVFRGLPADHPATVKGEAGSPYAIKDYYDVSPTLATSISKRMEEFEGLVKRTHEADLGCIIDFVPNHVARTYASDSAPEGVPDFGSNDDTRVAFDPKNNFYYLPDQTLTMGEGTSAYIETPAKVTGNDCFSSMPTHHDWYETVKLNYGVDYLNNKAPHFSPIPDTWKKMLDVLLYWADKGVDGFRCDMAEMVPIEFWYWSISEVRKSHPKILFIAEIYQPDLYQSYIQAGFDYLYDKVGLYDTLIKVLRGECPASEISRIHFAQEHIKGHMLRFMENHDEQRLASDFIIGDGDKAFPAMVISTLLGSTDGIMTYFGQEVGERGMDIEGFSGLDGRTTIFDYWSLSSMRRWIGKRNTYSGKDLTKDEISIREKYRTLLNTMLNHSALNKGKFFDLMYANNKQSIDHQYDYCFLRSDGTETFLIAVNFSSHLRRYDVTIPSHAFEILGIKDLTPIILEEVFTGSRGAAMLSSHEPIEVVVPPHGAAIYRMV